MEDDDESQVGIDERFGHDSDDDSDKDDEKYTHVHRHHDGFFPGLIVAVRALTDKGKKKNRRADPYALRCRLSRRPRCLTPNPISLYPPPPPLPTSSIFL